MTVKYEIKEVLADNIKELQQISRNIFRNLWLTK